MDTMKSRTILKTFSLLILANLIWVPPLFAKPGTSVKTTLSRVESSENGTKSMLVLPYAFSTEGMGLTAGVGAGTKGYGQDQLLVGVTAFTGVEDTSGLFLGVWDYQPSFVKRLFFSFDGMVAHYPRQRAYSKRTFDPDTPRPGSNDSDKNAYFEDSGYSNWLDITAEYVLPLGAAKTDPMIHNILRGGLLQSAPLGGEEWNPLKTGVTILLFQQYNRLRSFEPDEGNVEVTVHPISVGATYYNTDFPENPSTGSIQHVAITHDFGWFDSPDDWTFIEFEASKYFSLGKSDWAKQRIIALNLWTGNNLSWKENTNPDGTVTVTHRAPFYDGATLGGLYRMRAYPSNRFNDKAVLYTTAEYRYTLNWNPIGNISWLRFLESDWLQLAGFVEGGRVANHYNSDLLHDWQYDIGLGIRAMFSGAVVRLDIATCDESTTGWVMLGHPF